MNNLNPLSLHFSKILSNEDNYDNENIVYELSVSKTGYENRKIRGSIEAGGYQFLTIGIDYHPFDINFLENFGSIRRDWIENSYEYVGVEQFTDTMRVVDHYQNKPNYSIRTGSPYYYISQMKDYLSEKSSRELRNFRSRNESFWFDYYQSYGTVTNYEMEKNSFQDFPKGFQYFQGFSDWRRKYIQSSGGTQARVLIPYRFKFLYETGYKRIPVYEEVEYTRCRRKTYRITDYFLDKRENVGNVEIISRNGYDGRAHLKIQANEIDITLEKKHFDLNPSISTPLTLKLDNDIRNKEDRIVVEAMDNNGRVVETQSHDLSIDTEQKPPMENSIVNVVEADEKPDMEGKTSTVNKKLVGVKGELRDEETNELLLHGSDDASIRVDMQNLTEYGMPSGRYKAAWPLNYLYEFSLFTYETLEWKMDIRAEAQGYLAETKTARDSTNNQGLAYKNFKLLRKGNNPT